jgi:hypothetical protein
MMPARRKAPAERSLYETLAEAALERVAWARDRFAFLGAGHPLALCPGWAEEAEEFKAGGPVKISGGDLADALFDLGTPLDHRDPLRQGFVTVYPDGRYEPVKEA